MGNTNSEDKEITLKKLELEQSKLEGATKVALAQVEAGVKIKEIDASTKRQAVEMAHVTGLKWFYDAFGIGDANIQLGVLGAMTTSVAYGIRRVYQAMNIDFFERAVDNDAKETYARRAGFETAVHLRTALPLDKRRHKAMGAVGLIGMPFAMALYLIISKKRHDNTEDDV